VKIDIGCGTKKKDGFIGVDRIAFDGVDHVCNLGVDPLPFDHGTVEEVHASHFVEHLNAVERVYLFNDLHRVMKVGAKATIIVPHWSSARAYGDPTHQWPPMGEFSMYYLNAEWRATQAPHTDAKYWDKGYSCDFDATWGYGTHPALHVRSQEYQQHAVQFYKEAIQDLHCTLTRKG
jgi:hypothetical protein